MSNLFSPSNLSNSQAQYISETAEKQFLKFHLYPHTKVMLPIKQITEVLKIQFGQIVPIPQMPAWVMGVYNWRGDILWMVDLGHLIGLDSWYQQDLNGSNHTAIVLSPNKEQAKNNTSKNINLGLVVSQVEDIEMCKVADIQSPPNSQDTSQIKQFLQGYWLPPESDMVMVLDGAAIINAMPQNLTN